MTLIYPTEGTTIPLPFLKKKQIAGLIISHRKPDGEGIEADHSEENPNSAMEACAEDILRAISAKDSQHLALALQAAIDCHNSEDEDSNDFEAQNEKAAKDME